MRLPEKIRKALFETITFASGILVLILFRWTPTSGRGILLYVVLFGALLVMGIFLFPRRRAG